MTDIEQKAYMMQKVVQTSRPFSYFALSARAAAEYYAAQCPGLAKKDLTDVPELPCRALARLHTMWDDEKNPGEGRLIASYEDAFRAFEKSRALANEMKKCGWMPALRCAVRACSLRMDTSAPILTGCWRPIDWLPPLQRRHLKADSLRLRMMTNRKEITASRHGTAVICFGMNRKDGFYCTVKSKYVSGYGSFLSV